MADAAMKSDTEREGGSRGGGLVLRRWGGSALQYGAKAEAEADGEGEAEAEELRSLLEAYARGESAAHELHEALGSERSRARPQALSRGRAAAQREQMARRHARRCRACGRRSPRRRPAPPSWVCRRRWARRVQRPDSLRTGRRCTQAPWANEHFGGIWLPRSRGAGLPLARRERSATAASGAAAQQRQRSEDAVGYERGGERLGCRARMRGHTRDYAAVEHSLRTELTQCGADRDEALYAHAALEERSTAQASTYLMRPKRFLRHASCFRNRWSSRRGLEKQERHSGAAGAV